MLYKVLFLNLIIIFSYNLISEANGENKINSRMLALEINTPKREYVENEEIYVEARLRNISDEKITIYKKLSHGRDIMFHIKRDGVSIKKKFSIFHLYDTDKNDFIVLEPNSFYGRTFYIGNDFYPGIDMLGTIQVAAEYRNNIDGKEFGLSAWCGNLFSSPIELRTISRDSKRGSH